VDRLHKIKLSMKAADKNVNGGSILKQAKGREG
jgi:hypothetical protein